MTASTEMKLKREITSFYSLTIMNIGLAAVAMAISVSFAADNVLFLAKILTFSPLHIIASIMWFVAFGLSLKWLITSVEVMDGIGDIRDRYRELKSRMTDEEATHLIVQMMAYYREKKPVISRLTLASKAAGMCFIVIGCIQLAIPAIKLLSGQQVTLDPVLAISAAGSLLVSISGIAIPTYFERYASAWEERLDGSSKAEEELRKLLEGK